MHFKRTKLICLTAGALLALFLPLVVTASLSVAGHKPDRKVILISGYDFPNMLPGGNPERVHTRNENGTDQDVIGWQTIIDYLTQDKGTTENALVLASDFFDSDRAGSG